MMNSKGAEDKICPVPAWLESQGLREESLRAAVTGLGIEILGALCARAEPASARARLCSLVAQKFTSTMYTELCRYMESRHVQPDLKWPIVPSCAKADEETGGSIVILGIDGEDEDYVDPAVEERDLEDGTHAKFIRKFPCSSCSHSFTTKANLKIHMKRHRPVSSDATSKQIHNGDKSYSCAVCGKRFNRSSNHEVHMRSHTGERPYSCKVCAKSFSSEAVSLIHARVHSGEKPYVCNICGKRFSRSFRCQVHMHSHTGEPPYKCTICGKEFDQLIYHQYHTRTHTWDRTYTCNVCAKTFSQQSSLISHALIHSDNPVPTTMDGNLDYLLDHEFCKLPFEQQLQIKREGRPTPKLNITHIDGPSKSVKRCFSEDMYKKTEWLTGSMKQRRLYCWPCLLFDIKESSDSMASVSNCNPWTKKGFSDLKNLSRAIERHGRSKAHVTASLKLKLFDQVRINGASSQAATIGVKNHNEQVTKNRDVLRRLIDAVLFLGKRELAFRGHDKPETSRNKGNFVELVEILTKYDDVLAEHLKCAAVFHDLSKTIWNDIIDSVAHIINDDIDSEIASAPFIGVQVDDITDFSCKPQLTIVVRYVTKKGNICERFLGFFDTNQDRTPETLTAIVLKRLDKYIPTVKLVSQSYDGASCMAGQRSGVGTRVNSVCPYALFIHSYAHKLHLVLSQGTRAIQDAKLFFASLDSFRNFFARSAKQSALLEEAGSYCDRVASGSASRWNFKSRAVQAVHEGRQSLEVMFDRVINETWMGRRIDYAERCSKTHPPRFQVCFSTFRLSCNIWTCRDTLANPPVQASRPYKVV
uniref:C2H2-type domain-containing protein n=1 Tax=Eptatretus burgeri TaxID=7764 RepID=A0A8C4QQC1_EPTBU